MIDRGETENSVPENSVPLLAHKQCSPFERSLLSVVLPVYNEAQALPVLTARIAAVLAPLPLRYEIVFVNDGSDDESLQVLDQLAATSDAVRVVHLSRNFGHQAAVQAGLAHARGQAIVLMDSDMQDAPEAIPRFLAAWREGNDVVYAVRAQRKENFLKRLLFAAFHRLMSAVASVPIPTDAGIFGLIDRRVARQILAMGESDRYFPGLRSWVGFPQNGDSGRAQRPLRPPSPRLVARAGAAGQDRHVLLLDVPAGVFHVIGAAAMLVFLTLGGYAVFCRLFTDLAIPGWTRSC